MLNETLHRVAGTLDKLRVPYALIGGLAVAARGAFRSTKDVDLLIDWPLREAVSLARSLSEEGLPATFHRGLADDPVVGVIRVSVTTPAATINCDLLFPSKGWHEKAVEKATRVELGGFVVPVVQADDLFLLKLHAGGPQDLLDAADLLRMQSPADRKAWKKAAFERRLGNEYKQCLKFLKDAE